MDKPDVIKIRNVLRSVNYPKTIVNKDTGAKTVVNDIVPISIEFDNSLAVSEKTDIVMWDDANGIVYAVGFNVGQVKSGEYPMGTDTVLNPGVLYCVDYGEIQQFRVELNEKLFDGFMQKFKGLGVKVNFNGSEVTLTDAAIKRGKDFIFKGTDPMDVIKKDPLFKYK